MTHEKFNVLCWIWITTALVLFPLLLKITQPYGRHAKGNWGPMLNNRLGWFLMELPALIVFFFFLRFTTDFFSKKVLVASFLWGLHYIHRSLIFPLQIDTKGKMMPLAIVMSAVLFNTMNGFLNGYWLAHFVPDSKNSIPVDVRMVVGIILFITGFFINKYHDALLIKLRKSSANGYSIPYGGLFKYVSCPNFLGEIVTWLGFFVAIASLPAFSFLIWTLANLLTRAIDHHKWYLREFPNYPENRKAIFPYLL
jgi:3-oxo-5-alpha-steroid 4-dehydrogenase 1